MYSRGTGCPCLTSGPAPSTTRTGSRPSVGFYDTTLRDGEQTVGVVLSPEDKLELARGLDELGIERIEAGFPRVSEEDWRAVELIRDARLARGGMGLFARRRGRREGARRARSRGERDRVADLGPQARSARRRPRGDARADRLRDLVRSRAGHARCVLRRRRDARRLRRTSRRSTRRPSKPVRRKPSSWTRSASRARSSRRPRRPHCRMAGRRPDSLPRAQRLRPGNSGGGRRSAGRRALDPGHDQRHGRAGGQREPARDRTRAARSLRRRHEPAARRRPRLLGATAGTFRLRARAVQAARRRQPLPPRVGRSCEPVPRPAGDRAVLLRHRRSGTRRSCSARRAGSTRSGSRRKSSGSTWTTTRSATCSRASRSSGRRSATSSRTTNSASSRVADHDAVVVGSGINSLACAALLARAGWDVCVLEREAGARRRDQDGGADRARLPPRRLQRVAPALGRRARARGARRRACCTRARVPQHRAADGDDVPGRRQRVPDDESGRERRRARRGMVCARWRQSASRPSSSSACWAPSCGRGRAPGSVSARTGSSAAAASPRSGRRSCSRAATGCESTFGRSARTACWRPGCCTPGSVRTQRRRGS